MTATLWASRSDRRRISRARSAVLLFGGYDGSGNYGDVLQLAATLKTVRRVPGSPLPIAVVERPHARHAQLLLRHPSLLEGAAFVHYQDGTDRGRDGLVALRPGIAPSCSATYLYGGGYLNHWWGARKVALLAAAERLASPRPIPLVASGLQVEEATVAPGGVAHELLARASWLGVRDVGSLECLRRHLPGESGARVELAGDDAVPVLSQEPAPTEPVVNLHLHKGEHVSDDAER
ncbi:MAG TPA: polysaccharide pyruvyl transferase family protein, partial [Solirubrobacterales bacterium]